MPFTVEDFRDLIRIVEERPEWRADLRRLVLTDELLALPVQVANLRADTERGFQELAAAQQRTEEQVAGLTTQVTGLAAAQQRTETQVASLTTQVTSLAAAVTSLAAAQQRTETQVASLTTQVTSLAAAVTSLAAAQQRTEAQVASLTTQVTSLAAAVTSLAAAQQRTEAQVASLTTQVTALAAAQQRTEAQVASLTTQVIGLAAAQQRTEEQVAELTGQMVGLTAQVSGLILVVQTLKDDVGDLKGMGLERLYRERAPAYLARVLRRPHVLATEELVSLLDEAAERGRISEGEAEEVAWADLVVRGRRREDGAEVYFVVEVSWGIGPHDVERAVRRAALLAQLGTPVLPMVAGKTVTAEAAGLIRAMLVWQLTDGQVLPPERATDRS